MKKFILLIVIFIALAWFLAYKLLSDKRRQTRRKPRISPADRQEFQRI